jgi:hypothetical protein
LIGDHFPVVSSRYRRHAINSHGLNYKGERAGIFLHTDKGKPAFLSTPAGKVLDLDYMVKISDKEAILANRKGQLWKLTRKGL